MTVPPLVLGSTSAYRRELLARLGLTFTCDRPEVDESALPGEVPATQASRLARAKALAVASRHPGALVIGSDQVAELDGHAIGKPGTTAAACAQLAAASGRVVTFWTALALADTRDHTVAERLVRCDVHFRPLSAAEIIRYVAAEQPLDCAGSFKAEGLGIALFERISGDDPTALVGLPLIALAGLLRERGLAVP